MALEEAADRAFRRAHPQRLQQPLLDLHQGQIRLLGVELQ
jgi:hypothetical protein